MRSPFPLLLASLLVASVAGAPAQEDKKKDEKKEKEAQVAFVAQALHRLGAEFPEDIDPLKVKDPSQLKGVGLKGNAKVPPDDLERTRKALTQFAKTPNDETFLDLAKGLHKLAQDTETNSKVKITTMKDGKDNPGATVRYELDWDRRMKKADPQTGKDPTQCTEEMTIGWYYIWVERNKEPTSDRNSQFYIVKKEEKVTL